MRSDPAFIDWQAGAVIDPAERWPTWHELLRSVVGRGVRVRRARIVSEPISDYVRYEYDVTDGLNIAAGEQVRWLPRRQASGLAVPGNDFWLFDGTRLLVNHFDGDGESTGHELVEDPVVVKFCASSFEAVWDLAVPHADYRPS